VEILSASRDLPSAAIVARVFDAIDGFAGDAPQFDDITILVLRH
jgi:serine phosphatase RsbU (regulator of sigma subunit)